MEAVEISCLTETSCCRAFNTRYSSVGPRAGEQRRDGKEPRKGKIDQSPHSFLQFVLDSWPVSFQPAFLSSGDTSGTHRLGKGIRCRLRKRTTTVYPAATPNWNIASYPYSRNAAHCLYRSNYKRRTIHTHKVISRSSVQKPLSSARDEAPSLHSHFARMV